MQTDLEQVEKEILILDQKIPIKYENRDRFPPAKGIHNFRDLGGYRTLDGRNIKWGRLYRSGNLASTTEEDRQMLHQLGITTLVDFRSDSEYNQEPDRVLDGHPIQIVRVPIQEQGQAPLSPKIRQLIKDRKVDGVDPGEIMGQMYFKLAAEYTQQYKKFFQVLLDADGSPILWHCSAGKDRAGFAAALLLKILNVPDDTIMEDYLLSQGNVRPLGLKMLSITLLRGFKAARFARRMNDVDLNWLQEAFKTIESTWGYFDIYRSEALGLSQGDIDQLRAIYLE